MSTRIKLTASLKVVRAGISFEGKSQRGKSPWAVRVLTGAALLLAADRRQETCANKIAVSLAYSNASHQAGGSILIPHTAGDATYEASITVLQLVTYDPATVTAAIVGINNSIAHQELSLI